MPKIASLIIILLSCHFNGYCQNVGIGTTSPAAKLHVSEGSVLFSVLGPAPILVYNPPATGMGRRMMWYADKAAFRTGFVSNTAWDKDSIGYYSFATGYDAKASDVGAMAFSHYAQARGVYSFAMGYQSTALKQDAVAIGKNSLASEAGSMALGGSTTASGVSAVAIGSNSVASGAGAMALGGGAVASGISSFAIGSSCTASGYVSTALGYGATATGTQAIAIGAVTASGNGSTAIGGSNASTNGKIGACVIADNYNNAPLNSSANYQMSMRFSGGYRLYSWYDLSYGVQLSVGAGSWTALCDKRKKENFIAIDKEDILQKLAALPVSKWNYKAQPATQRHIGPMAQDFYAAFKLDGEGADTTINTMDIIGVSMAAIQALEKRTTDLKNENETLKAFHEKIMGELTALKSRLQKLEK